MDFQEAFNKAYLGVVKQGCKSVTAKGQCMLRGVDGSKCAVGHLISDEQMARWKIPSGAGVVSLSFAVLDELFPTTMNDNWNTVDFLRQMQRAHDDANPDPGEFIASFKASMASIASSYGLEIPSCD